MVRAARRTRSAFTMVELLLASTITALVAAASATLVSAVCNATVGTRDSRATNGEGHFTLAQLTRLVRGSRAVGELTPTAASLWLADTNGNDRINLYETGIITYDTVNKRILLNRMQKANGSIPTSTVTPAQFKSVATLQSLYGGQDYKSIELASSVSGFKLMGWPSATDMHIVNVAFALTKDNQTTQFEAAASPRAPGDYLFYAQTQGTPPIGTTRKVRAIVSPFDGFASVLGTLTALVGL
jgi:type II secretory pathway pseudopilin PulG